jgi:hypothetical protein
MGWLELPRQQGTKTVAASISTALYVGFIVCRVSFEKDCMNAPCCRAEPCSVGDLRLLLQQGSVEGVETAEHGRKNAMNVRSGLFKPRSEPIANVSCAHE